MSLPGYLDLEVVTNLPAATVGAGGIVIDKQNGVWTFTLDAGALPVDPAPDVNTAATIITTVGGNKRVLLKDVVPDATLQNAKLANVAQGTFKARQTADTGPVEDLTPQQAADLLPAFTGDTGTVGGKKGVVPAPQAGDAGVGKYLRADGSWSIPPTGIPGENSVGNAQLQNGAVSNNKMAAMPTNTLKGNNDGVDAAPQDLTPDEARALLDAAKSDLSNTTGPRGKLSPVFAGDANTLLENGRWVVTDAATNMPVAGQFWMLETAIDNTTTWATQYATIFGADSSMDSLRHKRERNNGIWGSWYRTRENEAELDARYARVNSVGLSTNLLINSFGDINQRATANGAIAAGVFIRDRFKAGAAGANVSVSAAGLWTLTSGSIEQVIELNFLAKGSFANGTLTVAVNDLTGGNLTVTAGGVSGTITAGSGIRSVTLNLGAGVTGNVTVNFAGAGVSFMWPRAGRGSNPPLIIERDELLLCYRYFEVHGVTNNHLMQSDNYARTQWYFKATKRVSNPAISFPAGNLYDSAAATATGVYFYRSGATVQVGPDTTASAEL